MPINKSDITFICSGRIFHHGPFSTLNCFKAVKKYFPQSPLILTTWKGENINNLRPYCDKIILTKLPPMPYSTCLKSCSWYPKPNSYDLQQKCVSAGLKKCQTRYAVRLRTDFVLQNDTFLSNYQTYLAAFPSRLPSYSLFQEKVLIYSLGTISPYTKDLPLIHHPSELFHFGLTSDLQKLWCNNKMPSKIAAYFSNPSPKYPNPCLFNHRFTPEQWIWLSALKAHNMAYRHPEYYLSLNAEMRAEQDKLFISNFIILDTENIGISSKFTAKLAPSRHRFYNDTLYLTAYRKFFTVTQENPLIRNLILQIKIKHNHHKINKSVRKLNKHFKYVFLPLKSVFRWVSHLFSTIYYSFKSALYILWYFPQNTILKLMQPSPKRSPD